MGAMGGIRGFLGRRASLPGFAETSLVVGDEGGGSGGRVMLGVDIVAVLAIGFDSRDFTVSAS